MKVMLINIAALICAIAIFSGTLVYSAGEMPVVNTTIEPVAQDIDFLQNNELSIGELINEDGSSQQSSSEVTSIEHTSSKIVSSVAQTSSKLPAKVSSSNTPKLSTKPSSSAIPSSSKPLSISSEIESQVSSEKPISSEQPPIVIEGDYAGILEVLAGAVQREIIGTNTNPLPQYYEAYKAQAVASHSYMEYHKARTGSYPPMSYSTPKQQTIDLVAEVLNVLIYYNGTIINASYHAAAGGYTQSASYIWGGSIPYLVGVESKYDDYSQTIAVSVSNVQEKLISNGVSVSGDPSSWFDLSGASLTDGGFIDYILICGQSIKGRTLRENILGTTILKSPKIIGIEVSGSDFIFATKGYGHGAGLSQQGAKGYASNEGWNYKSILTHYYSGITIQ